MIIMKTCLIDGLMTGLKICLDIAAILCGPRCPFDALMPCLWMYHAADDYAGDVPRMVADDMI